jgi:hypothetical protein
MADLNQDQMANAVASGKHRYDLDKVIGWQVILGILAVATGQFATIPVGAGLLVLTLYFRNKA